MITILCSGSRGDFQPYIALAQELKLLSKEVRIAGQRDFEGFIRGYGIDFYPIQADFASLNVDPKMMKQAQNADNPLKMLLAFNKMKNYGSILTGEFYEACVDSEAIVYHPGMTIGYFAAQKLGIPSILASPFPIHTTSSVASVILYGRTKAKWMTRMSYGMLQGMLWMISKDAVKDFWKGKFNELPKGFKMPYEKHDDEMHPAVISCSNHVFPRPRDWNPHVHQYGYWFVKEEKEYTPSPELKAFLDQGDKPVYIGFGSMFSDDIKERYSKIAIEALRISGKRGILSGMGKFDSLPETVIAIDGAPHTWLFPKVSAIVHHGGAGTTASGFLSGVPSIITPFSNDQFAWAARSYDLGVGASPIPIKKLTVENLVERLEYIDLEKIRNQAKKLGEKIAQENGARDCANVIASLLG